MTAMAKVTCVLMMSGLIFAAQGAWIPAKAYLAHHLLDQAFEKGKQERKAQKPWQWADFKIVGTLHFKGKRIHVLDRATNQALAFGAGLHEETFSQHDSLVLSGHRDTHFRALEAINVGDSFEYKGLARRDIYEVVETAIFDIRRETIMAPGKGEILLLTCWPFNGIDPSSPNRFAVLAKHKFSETLPRYGAAQSGDVLDSQRSSAFKETDIRF